MQDRAATGIDMRIVRKITLLSLLLALVIPATGLYAQEKDINGAKKSSSGIGLDTNVSFTLRMTLAGDDTPLAAVNLGQDVSITAIMRPESSDIGEVADIIMVDALPPIFTMRNTDGNFVAWNGVLTSLVPYLEGVTLEEELEVEIFSGQLGSTGNHRIYVAFLVNDILYFTPSALKFDINEAPAPELSAREQAITLFNSTISSSVVQSSCIQCHISGGQGPLGGASHIFVDDFNPDHLTLNFEVMEDLHGFFGKDFILGKVSGTIVHSGGAPISQGSSTYNSFSDFLDLLDQAESE